MGQHQLKKSRPYPVRINDALHKMLKQVAQSSDRTMNQLIMLAMKSIASNNCNKYKVTSGEKKGLIFDGMQIDFEENQLYVIDFYGNKYSVEQLKKLK